MQFSSVSIPDCNLTGILACVLTGILDDIFTGVLDCTSFTCILDGVSVFMLTALPLSGFVSSHDWKFQSQLTFLSHF